MIYINGFHCILTDAEVEFVVDEYFVTEESGSVSVCVESGVMCGFETELTVSLTAQDGTACEIHSVTLYI